MQDQCWFYCYPEKLLCDTLHLTVHDFGAYTRLLMWYYVNGPLAADEEQIRTVCGVKDQDWARCWGNIKPFFTPNGDGTFHQKRADIEIKRRNDLISRNRSKTAEARAAAIQAARARNSTQPVTQSVTVSDRISWEMELSRVEKRIEDVRRQGTVMANGTTYTAAQRAELAQMKARRQELLGLLGFKA